MTPQCPLRATVLALPEPRLLGGPGPGSAAVGSRAGGPAGPARGSRAGQQPPHSHSGAVLAPSPVSSCPASLLPAGRRPHRPLSPSFPRGCVRGAGRAPRRACPCPPAGAAAPVPLLPSLLRGSSQPVVSICRPRVVARSSAAGTLPVFRHCPEHPLALCGGGWPAEPGACAVGTGTEWEASSTPSSC